MITRIKEYISDNKLLDKEKLHLVALSGGADSVFLLLTLKELGYKVHAMHCNFHLRGEESNRDEAFCIRLCEEQGIELHLTHFDTKTFAEVHKMSIEMAARELRYQYFEEVRLALGADTIVVAHHRDDNIETFLMNILRGTGIHGLEAIKPRNGRIMRPLLCVSRREIEDCLTMRRQEYVTDSTNLVDDVLRNKIRLNLLPMLEELNPTVRSNITKTIEHVAESVKIVDDAIVRGMASCMQPTQNGCVISLARLLEEPSPETILFHIMTDYGFSSAQAEQVFRNINAPSGRIWQSPSHIIATDRDTLIIDIKDDDDADKRLTIPEEGTYIYNVRVKVRLTTAERTSTMQPSRQPNIATLDADKVTFPVTIRHTTEGDAFKPFGMKGRKLVSDYLTDRKRNYFQRRRQLLMEDANGTVIWLIGERTAQQAAITTATRRILTISVENE